MKHFLFALLAAVLLIPSPSEGQELHLDVPFVPTPMEVVAEMLRMAEVRPGDIVYDLGCGDGRIVITAAREMGARGVGIDKNPRRIDECLANARSAGVMGQVRFLKEDLFTADIREATVVTMYLLQEVNQRLRPRLLRELRPGARIVSHNYDLRGWRPDQAVTRGSHSVYGWVVPANVTGIWTWEESGSERTRGALSLAQRFQDVAGEVNIGGFRFMLTESVLRGDRLRIAFDRPLGGKRILCRIEAGVTGNVAEGVAEHTVDGKTIRRLWKATRDSTTVMPIADTED